MTTTPPSESPTTISTTPTRSDEILYHEEVEAFRRFVAQLKPPPEASTSFAHLGTSAFALNASFSTPSSSWIIDPRASYMWSLFSSYHVYSRRDKVYIADGSYSSIASKCDIVASLLNLSSVFHVPNFSLKSCLLVILQNLLIVVTFLPSHYVFQDLETRKMIGQGFEKDGLYLLDTSLQLLHLYNKFLYRQRV